MHHSCAVAVGDILVRDNPEGSPSFVAILTVLLEVFEIVEKRLVGPAH